MSGRTESGKSGVDPEVKPDQEGSAAKPAKGGFGAFVPLLANLLLMPAVAFGVAHFYLLPQLRGAKAEVEISGQKPAEHKKGKDSKAKFTVPLSGKILVNVSGTAGTRYLVANMTLVSNDPDLKTMIESHDAQLRDAAAGILSVKTIADLEKPGIRNLIRSEMISVFNDIFGRNLVNEIYLTEFAIQ
jgi:flagellar protein FliL